MTTICCYIYFQTLFSLTGLKNKIKNVDFTCLFSQKSIEDELGLDKKKKGFSSALLTQLIVTILILQCYAYITRGAYLYMIIPVSIAYFLYLVSKGKTIAYLGIALCFFLVSIINLISLDGYAEIATIPGFLLTYFILFVYQVEITRAKINK